MKYIYVRWVHTIETEPIRLYSELDDELWERRKVEIYANGTCSYASKEEHLGTARLSEEPLPPIEEIALDPQFQPSEISKTEFEKLWRSVHDQKETFLAPR